MEWHDEGILLSSRQHGERDAIVSILTFEHGRHAGLVAGGAGRRATPLLQPGNRLDCIWRARLEEQLGRFTVEPIRLFASILLEDRERLTAITSACAVVDILLAEREPHADLYAGLLTLLGLLVSDPAWAEAYVRFELLLLAELGFGLDLTACAVTGATLDLAYVSPKSGRAVAREAAGPWADRLLPLPAFLVADHTASPQEIAQGLRLAGHFLRRHILDPTDRTEPVARERFVGLWRDQPNESP